jgi:adenylate cyclase
MADQRLTAEQVRSALMGEHVRLLWRRHVFRRLPSPPRCKLCAVPFAGIGGLVLRHVGFARSPGNPSLCTKCLGKLRKQGMSGVEIPVTLLFSDVRGSTALGEQMRPTDFHAFLKRFYRLASEAIIGHDGLVDKVVGDEVVALFFGGISGPNHAAAAVAAAIDVAERAARPNATPSGPIPVGTGVHTGEAFVGGTGPGRHDRGLHGARRCRQHRSEACCRRAGWRSDRQRRGGRGGGRRRPGAAHSRDPRPGGADRGDRPPPVRRL